MDQPCCKVGAIALILAQLAWAVSSLHERAQPEDGADMTGHRTLAFGMICISLALAGASVRAPSLTMPAATVCLLTTATTAWYASRLNPGSAVSTAGYGASLFSTAASLLLLTADVMSSGASDPHGAAELVVLAPVDIPLMDAPPAGAPPIEFYGWEYVDADEDALLY